MSFDAVLDDASVTVGNAGTIIVTGCVADSATVLVQGDATSVDIGEDIRDGSRVEVQGSVDWVLVGEDIEDGSTLRVGGDANLITVTQDIQNPGSSLEVGGHVDSLVLGDEVKLGATVELGSAGAVVGNVLGPGSSLHVLGDATSIEFDDVLPGASVVVEAAFGPFLFVDDATRYELDYDVPTRFEYDGTEAIDGLAPPPAITGTGFTVDAFNPSGVPVGQIEADVPIEGLRLSLVDNGDGRFTIDEHGVIRAAGGSSFDTVAEPSISITVAAVDSVGRTFEFTFDVSVVGVVADPPDPGPAPDAEPTAGEPDLEPDPQVDPVPTPDAGAGPEPPAIDPPTDADPEPGPVFVDVPGVEAPFNVPAFLSSVETDPVAAAEEAIDDATAVFEDEAEALAVLDSLADLDGMVERYESFVGEVEPAAPVDADEATPALPPIESVSVERVENLDITTRELDIEARDIEIDRPEIAALPGAVNDFVFVDVGDISETGPMASSGTIDTTSSGSSDGSSVQGEDKASERQRSSEIERMRAEEESEKAGVIGAVFALIRGLSGTGRDTNQEEGPDKRGR